ncbi:hypothetical protein EPUS_00426 [Endocarpon pusillum Z07020]|uniref:Uncharacterized protein n=1 Tax=Endocarpon pusillum (strain Z07020 / HMAS-L-300199) TaxID=1263415 RepID=U1GDT6_ENDPU|nr:uncharacterized protein EPUS_00426 [Endocarpon pusillum Z07020]ERF70238.1 hypothetical protein EPUS_00426 [Endocarpon pusillum Z07020]
MSRAKWQKPPNIEQPLISQVDEDSIRKDDHDPRSSDLLSLGKPQQKKRLDYSTALGVLACWLCLSAAIVTVSPYTRVPWILGLQRQFQVIGFLIGVMNQLFLGLTPKVFLLIEARFGPSYLQNFEAILRRSYLGSGTSILWRGVLFGITLLHLGLGVAYKEFTDGRSEYPFKISNDSFYGLTGPTNFKEGLLFGLGLTSMANSTLPFYSATVSDPPMPSFPHAYGFNTLLLSETSSAKLDSPFPEYVEQIQTNLTAEDSYILTAEVFATVTSYNDSIASHRNDDKFWDYYTNMMGNTSNLYDSKDANFGAKIQWQDMLVRRGALALLVNDLGIRNTSWMFAAFISAFPKPEVSWNISRRRETYLAVGAEFRQNAMLFHTRRERCKGSWRITYNSIELISGACLQAPTSEKIQKMFTNATLAIPTWYMPSLIEYLGGFGMHRNESRWLVPSFSTVIAGVFWSRVTRMQGRYGRVGNPQAVLQSDVYYHCNDEGIKVKQTMSTSPWLFVTLIVLPFLTLLLLLASVAMFHTPLGEGFGLITVLAGVCKDTLRLVNGASLSGELKRRLRVKFIVHKDGGHPRVEYVLGDEGPNDKL